VKARREGREERSERGERGREARMHFRETIVWQKAMSAVDELYRLVPCLPREETYGLRSQITRAAVSIPANIAGHRVQVNGLRSGIPVLSAM
jgi:hypothetical protein